MRHSHQIFANLLTTLVSFFIVAGTVQGEVIDVDNQKLEHLLEKGVPIIDIRTPPEWGSTGVIEGSHLLTFFDSKGRYDASAFVAKLKEVAKPDDEVILICRTGNRTRQVAGFLDQRAGYTKVYNVSSGILDWIQDQHPVVTIKKSEKSTITASH